jgi:hypothetical protein
MGHKAIAASDDRLKSAKPTWLELAYVDEREAAKTAWVVVMLSCNEQLIAGMSPVIKKRRQRHGIHRAALATLNAIELFSDHTLACELVDVAMVTVGGGASLLVRVRVTSDGTPTELFGIARVEGDLAETSVRAVLDAVNLFIDSLLTRTN